MSEQLVLLAIVIAAISGLPGLIFSRTSNLGQQVGVFLAVVASCFGLCGVGTFWVTGISTPIVRSWAVPGAEFNVAMDGLSALFLVPIFFVSMLGSVYELGYWKQSEHPGNGQKLRLFYGLLPAGMALLVISRNSFLFMAGWEVMALSAFFLVTTEDHLPDVRFTGWVYLVSTKFATVSLFALFALLRAASGSFTLETLPDGAVTHGMATAIFVFTILGFGLKAGMMPLHVWLPSSHAIAPSHVSAIMSGVIIKMGIYGILRVTSMVPHPPLEWGGILLTLGAISGVLGIAFSISQHDVKRLLAYSSIENIGIIIMGIGLALAGRSLGHGDWVILGLCGAMLHVWNHATFKGLLFLSAGSIIHGAKSREIDLMGGLAKQMPITSKCFVIGALAVCGLPPLNGFSSEFLIYLGLFKTLNEEAGHPLSGAALAAPVLALIGALAVACFVKVFGIIFLGSPRSENSRHAHESEQFMTGPMCVLAAFCFAIGLAPVVIAPVLLKGAIAWAPEMTDISSQTALVSSMGWISSMSVVLVIALVVISFLLAVLLRNSVVVLGPTWGCGYVAPTPRIQYTSSSFAQMLVSLFGWALRPRTKVPKLQALFPQPSDYQSEVLDPVLDEAVLPTFHFAADKFSWIHVLQHGNIQAYLLYIFGAIVALLLW